MNRQGRGRGFARSGQRRAQAHPRHALADSGADKGSQGFASVRVRVRRDFPGAGGGVPPFLPSGNFPGHVPRVPVIRHPGRTYSGQVRNRRVAWNRIRSDPLRGRYGFGNSCRIRAGSLTLEPRTIFSTPVEERKTTDSWRIGFSSTNASNPWISIPFRPHTYKRSSRSCTSRSSGFSDGRFSAIRLALNTGAVNMA